MKSGFYLCLTLPLLLAMAVNAYGLTTFGKSSNTPPNQPQNPPQPVTRGRECQFEKDCAQISNTSCVMDPLDGKTTRCLCGDYKAPVNGACKTKVKGVNHACMASDECADGSECMPYKDAGNRGVAKVCKCSEGFVEVDFACSGGATMSVLPAFMAAIMASLALMAAAPTY